jgi:hypothetical protein
VLTRACFGDDPLLPLPYRQEDLANRVVEFVRAREIKILAFEIDLTAL